MSAQIRRYLRQKQDWEFKRGYTADQMKASDLRKNFLKQFIIDFDTHLYSTQEERDWAYLAKRQYNYDVVLKSIGYSCIIANVLLSWRIYVNKAMVWWPLFTIPVTYPFLTPILLQKHNKKLFDMCNLGEEFHLGYKRNEVLRQCNKILDCQDF